MSANIAPVREPENSESKSDDAHLQLLQTFLAIKRNVDVEELRAQADMGQKIEGGLNECIATVG